MVDGDGDQKLGLVSEVGGHLGLNIYSSDNKQISVGFNDKNNQAEVSISKDNKNIIAFGTFPKGPTSLSVWDKDGKGRVGIGVKADGSFGVWLLDNQGNSIKGKTFESNDKINN